MLAGLSCALQLIEAVVVRTSPRHRALYQGEHVGTMGTAELLRLMPLPCELSPLSAALAERAGTGEAGSAACTLTPSPVFLFACCHASSVMLVTILLLIAYTLLAEFR